MSLTVACTFREDYYTTFNVIHLEKLWVRKKKILEKKEKVNSDLWIYDKDVNNVIKEFTKA